ncbi:MAG: T9SS type A sorting domain-containing protein, partial [Ferruginibacter sp.]
TVSANNIVNNNSITTNNCGLIAKVVPNGAEPVSGSLNARIWIQANTPLHNGNPYVLRHYELTPVTNSANATATVTLYYTQADFDAYNNTPAHGNNLPTHPTDAAGKLNIRIVKFGGQSNDGTGVPSSYTGSPITITPLVADIVWNSTNAYWEISFDVTGFSGFFLNSSGGVVLPVTLQQIQAKAIQNNIQVQWITDMETGAQHFELERSTNAQRGFETIYTINASGRANGNTYQFNDVSVLKNVRFFYRLKIVDADGTFKYAPIVSAKVNGSNTIVIYPNPVKVGENIRVIQNNAFVQQWQLMNAAGQIVCKGNATSNNILISTETLQSGIYHLLIQTDHERLSYKVIVKGN